MLSNNNKPWATTGNLLDTKHDIYGNKMKSVMFSARVHVILIPSISEYEAAGLAPLLWWADDDYKEFKLSALQEVKDYMTSHSLTDSKEAIKNLYQSIDSSEDEYDNTDDQSVVSDTTYSTAYSPSGSRYSNNDSALQSPESISSPISPIDKQGQSGDKSNNKSNSKPDIKDQLIEGECNTASIFSFKKLGKLMKPHSFCVYSSTSRDSPLSQIKRDLEITSFRSKTDVDIIHDRRSDRASRDFLANLRKLHQNMTSQAPSSASDAPVTEVVVQGQVHPLALICS
jgi:hypothetical protein